MMATITTTNPADANLFGPFPLNPSTLSVAQENFTASKPPIRNLNVTHEILTLLRSHQVKESLRQVFDEHMQNNRSALKDNTIPFKRRKN